MKISAFIIMIVLAVFRTSGQNASSSVSTVDINNFWNAYDSIRSTTDSTQQLQYIQKLYIDKGTPGLHAFMRARDYTAELWLTKIKLYPRFWNSIRPNTFALQAKAKQIENSIQKLKSLYPSLRPARLYFTIGGLRSGGTTMNDMVLIGAEIATGTADTDVSEFPDKWLEGVFRSQDPDNIVPLNIHEYVHTQQKGSSNNLLGQSIREGACDFITELVMGKPMLNNYIVYGREHEQELKEQFRKEMFTAYYSNWLYNGASAKTVADLGYFMGYAICTAYYNRASDKKKAISQIIELDYSNEKAVEKFLKRSGYYTERINQKALIRDFEARRPSVVRLEPFNNGDMAVDPSAKEMKIIFSAPMNKKSISINYGSRGKDYSPIAGIGGFSEDGTSFIIKLALQPDHEYEFRITDLSFKSVEGYPLKPLDVRFRTRNQ